jgi:hypothetical protein
MISPEESKVLVAGTGEILDSEPHLQKTQNKTKDLTVTLRELVDGDNGDAVALCLALMLG